MYEAKPLDIVVLKGKKNNLFGKIIEWKSNSPYTHCVVIKDKSHNIFDPNIGGINTLWLPCHYYERECVILRYNKPFDEEKIMRWLLEKQATAKGYDYIAWLGFATGLKYLEDEDRWFCSEVPYWMFQDNGYNLTAMDMTFVYPGDLVKNMDFDIVYKGLVGDISKI